MASRPLYNGSSRVVADNGAAGALRNGFAMRASIDALDATEAVGNAAFQAEAGQTFTIQWEAKKVGAGAEVDTPTDARVRIFRDDDSDSLRTGAVFESADLISGALPLSGTVAWTPTEAGTYRIQVEMQKGNGDFSNTSSDWRVLSDALAITRGALALINTAVAADKGRLRAGERVNALAVTERTNAAPATFAFTAGATETVRLEATFSHNQNKTTSTEVYRFRHRRNGTATVDAAPASTRITSSLHRGDAAVTLINFPLNNVSTTYDAIVATEANSALHTANSPQYTGLSGAAASGAWVHFTAVGAGLTLVDFATVARLASHVVNPGGSIENIFVKRSSTYTETAGIPDPPEETDFIATAENMTVKVGRVLNARGEAVSGVFVASEVAHVASGAEREEWGRDSGAFATVANGWQGSAHVVTVSTPPAGLHRVVATAYFPSGTEGSPALRQFSQSRTESDKNWIAPATFQTAVVVAPPVVTAGASVAFSIHVYNRDVAADADVVPACTVYRNRSDTVYASPVLTKRAGTTGIYDGTLATATLADATTPDVYEITAYVTVQSFPRMVGESVEAVAINAHDGYSLDPIGLALSGVLSTR